MFPQEARLIKGLKYHVLQEACLGLQCLSFIYFFVLFVYNSVNVYDCNVFVMCQNLRIFPLQAR